MKGKITVRVYHSYYGCDTGCCGHRIELTDEDGKTDEEFDFCHPWGDKRTWAKELAEEYIRKNHPTCVDSIDWDTLDFEEVTGNC